MAALSFRNIQSDLRVSFQSLQFGIAPRGSEVLIHSVRTLMTAYPTYDIYFADGINRTLLSTVPVVLNHCFIFNKIFQKLLLLFINFMAPLPNCGTIWILADLILSLLMKVFNKVILHPLFSIVLPFMTSFINCRHSYSIPPTEKPSHSSS